MMRTFSLFTTDARYSVPTLALLVVESEQQAIERAQATLRASHFHRAVELCDDQRRIYQEIRSEPGVLN